MPTPKYHGGAPIAPINLTAPSFQGLNTADEASILGVEWATTLTNAVFDDQGRPSIRKGWVNGTTTSYDGTEKLIKRIHEYWMSDETSEIISSTDDNILTGTTNLSDATASIDGTLSISDGNIKFVNYNDNCIAFGIGASGAPAVYTGTGNFTSVTPSSGTAPNGTIGTAAFGRLWGVDNDLRTIRYSGLLTHTAWAVTDGGGSIDMAQVWPDGQDTVVAIEEFGGDLVVFGKRSVVIWTDGRGAALGIDPVFMYVADTIGGTGAVSQFGMTKANGDLWFISPQGVTSLGRELVQRSTQIQNVSKNVQPTILAALDNELTGDDVTLEYVPSENFVLAIFPASEQTFVFDAERILQDGTAKTTLWSVPLQTASYALSGKILRGSLSLDSSSAVAGELYSHSGFTDDGDAYPFSYESGWLDMGEEAAMFNKYVKKMSSIVFVSQNTTVNHTIKYDFGEGSETIPVNVTTASASSEYNIAEYGSNGSRDPNDGTLVAGTDVAEYAGATISLQKLSAPGAGGGQYMKVGLSLNNNSAEFALQSINLFAKIGRIAH